MEIPNLRFPFDVSGGAARFQTRRCDLRGATLVVDEAQLQAWVESRPRLPRYGMLQPRVVVRENAILLTVRARVADREAPVVAEIELARAPDGQGLYAFIAQ